MVSQPVRFLFFLPLLLCSINLYGEPASPLPESATITESHGAFFTTSEPDNTALLPQSSNIMETAMLPTSSITLSLAEAVQEALKANPDLDIARTRLDAVRAQVQQAQAAFFPRLTASLQYSERESPSSTLGFGGIGGGGDIHTIQYTDGLNMQIPLDIGGKLKSGLKRARVSQSKSVKDLEATVSDVILGTLDACLNHLKAVALLETAREKRESLESHRRIVQQRMDNDLALKTDLLKAEVQLESSRESELLAGNTIENTRSTVNQVLGRPIEDCLNIASSPTLHLPVVSLSDLRAGALARNPSLTAAQEQVKVLKAATMVERAQHRPNLSLSGSTGRTSRDIPPRENAWSVGGTLDWKVFDGGLQSSRVREAGARLREAQAQEEKIRQAILVQLQIAHSQSETAKARVEISRKALELAREELRLSTLQVQEGLITFTDFLDNQAEFTRARVAAIVADFDLSLSWLRLMHLSGSLTRDFAEKISKDFADRSSKETDVANP